MAHRKPHIVSAVFSTAGIIFVLLFFVRVQAEMQKPDNFLQYGCTVDCMGETCALKQGLSGASATQCIKEAKNKTYEESNRCIASCVQKPTVGATVKAGTARDNCGEGAKVLHSASYLGDERCKPFRSDKKVDFLTSLVNQNLSEGGRRCPMGTHPSDDGISCGPCPQGSELDNLHTVCLNKKELTDNVKFLYSLLPGDIQNEISKKIGEEVKKRFGGGKLGSLLADVAESAIDDEAIADFVYTTYIHNTLNLRRLIQRVGSDEGAKIFLKLFEAAKKRREEAPQKPPSENQGASSAVTKQPAHKGTAVNVEESIQNCVTKLLEAAEQSGYKKSAVEQTLRSSCQEQVKCTPKWDIGYQGDPNENLLLAGQGRWVPRDGVEPIVKTDSADPHYKPYTGCTCKSGYHESAGLCVK